MPSRNLASDGTYFPRRVSTIGPRGDNMFEFLVVGKDSVAALATISTIFSKHNVNISAYGGHVEEPNDFVQILFCNFYKADCPAETVEAELKSLPFVKIVRSHHMDEVVYEKFLFPVEVAGRRAVVMRLEALVDMERRLNSKMGSGASAIMFDEGKAYSISSLQELKETLGNPSTDVLLQNVMESFKTGGWGILEVKKEKDGYDATVAHPPSNRDGTVTLSRFLLGNVAGSLEGIYGEELVVVASSYNKIKDVLWFKLKSRNAR